MVVSWMSSDLATDLGIKKPEAATYGRTPFLRDYGAVIHSSKFRRLAYKTQVYLNPQVDFPRTRLPHSVEVSQIGRQLARALCACLSQESLAEYERAHGSPFRTDFEDLVATACLAHDLGQPPFGHKGDRTLKKLLEKVPAERFEANKQNARLLLGSPARGAFEVTSALVDAVMKYKDMAIFGDYKAPGHYAYEAAAVKAVLSKTGTGSMRHPACYLMEAADDIAYLSGDIEDALKLGVLDNTDELKERLKHLPILDDDYKSTGEDWNSFLHDRGNYSEATSGKIIKALIKNTIDHLRAAASGAVLEVLPEILHQYAIKHGLAGEPMNLLYFGADGSKNAALKECLYQKRIVNHSDVAQAEILAEKVIAGLWDALVPLAKKDSYKAERVYYVVPKYVQKIIEDVHTAGVDDKEMYQIIADYISGMTDRFAIDLWSRLYSPQRLAFAG